MPYYPRCVAVPVAGVLDRPILVGPGFLCFVAGVNACRVALVGLNRPFRLENVLSSWLFSWITSGQPHLCQVQSWRHIAPMSVFALIWAPCGDVSSLHLSSQCSALTMCLPFSGSTLDLHPPSVGSLRSSLSLSLCSSASGLRQPSQI